MCKKVWNKYIKGFKFLLPFILLQVLIEVKMLDFKHDIYDVLEVTENIWGNFSVIIEFLKTDSINMLLYLFVGSLFYSILMLGIKELVDKNYINYGITFKESLRYYLRYLALNIIIYAISIGILLIGSCVIFIPIVFIALLYVTVILTPCKAYLIYYDKSPMEALKKGIVIGKKYFVQILAVGSLIGLITELNIGIKSTFIGLIFIYFIAVCVEMYLYMFSVSICKEEKI
ncbi:hypothetical protein [Clostridium rectalis]|uniref:hypothetical protein n=1 Tax=Clostridium rectalis TaxID=2040295 RepID=UPI000F63065F|nr:hypothetical protein [Clostridium rectalis]